MLLHNLLQFMNTQYSEVKPIYFCYHSLDIEHNYSHLNIWVTLERSLFPVSLLFSVIIKQCLLKLHSCFLNLLPL